MKLPGFHRRRILALIILIAGGVWMEWMRVESGISEIGEIGEMSRWSELSGSQPWIKLFVWPPIGDIWMDEAYHADDRLRWAVYAISDREAQAQLAEAARLGTDVRIMLE